MSSTSRRHARQTENPSLLIVNCADRYDLADDWRFLADDIQTDGSVQWRFHSSRPRNVLERHITRPRIARLRSCFFAAIDARRTPSVMITHLPRVTTWAAIMARVVGARCPHLAFAFNFTVLPGRLSTLIMRMAFKSVTTFVVFAEVERLLYSAHFGIPIERFVVLPWAMDEPTVALQRGPQSAERFVCALGGEGRDYPTLMEAARLTPDISYVVVGRVLPPEVPCNVEFFTNLPNEVAWRILKDAAISVVPLISENTNCGHITCVASSLLGRPLVTTDSVGLTDYVEDGVNGLTCEAGDAAELAKRVAVLWNDDQAARALGESGRELARARHSLANWIEFLSDYLRRHGPPIDSPDAV